VKANTLPCACSRLVMPDFWEDIMMARYPGFLSAEIAEPLEFILLPFTHSHQV